MGFKDYRIGKHAHHGRYAGRLEGAEEYRRARNTRRADFYGSKRCYQRECSYEKSNRLVVDTTVQKLNHSLDLEEGECSPDAYLSSFRVQNSRLLTSSSRGSSRISSPNRTPKEEIDDLLDLLYDNIRSQDKLSPVLDDPEVVADRHKRQYHWGLRSARQFDMSLQHVMDMLRHMYERYDTITVYSMRMLPSGSIIYWLEPFTLGFDQSDQGRNTVQVGEARVHLKGRFGIVVDHFDHHLKVVEAYTFGGEGLAKKPQRVWHEYVGLRAAEHRGWMNPSPNKPLEVGGSCCDLSPETSVHLLTSKITLSNQILIAGCITSDSLDRLRTQIKKLENRLRR